MPKVQSLVDRPLHRWLVERARKEDVTLSKLVGRVLKEYRDAEEKKFTTHTEATHV